MKKITLLLFFICLAASLTSQNLVPNPSFEEYYQCPSSQGSFYVDFWFNTPNSGVATPDFYHTCAPAGANAAVPDNITGFQYPQEGEGYAGLFCYGSDSNQREYIEVQLISPLIEGQEYEFSMYVSLADHYGAAINNIGVAVTDYIVEGNGQIGVIPETPQIKAIDPISDEENWTQIAGTFIAEGGEEYLTIGNFFSDEDTEKISIWGSPFLNWGYYYFDSVSLTPVILSTNDEILDNQLKVYPNPTSNLVTIELTNNYSSNVTYKLYNLLGELIYTSESNDQLFSIDISDLSRGIYLLELTDAQSNKVVKKISKL